MAVGISMVIDDKFLERLSAADTKLEELAKKSEDVRGRIIQSFKSMGDDGVGYFIQKINEAKTALEGLAKGSGKITIDAKGIEVVGTSATKSADDVNKLVQVVDTLAKLNEKLSKNQSNAKKYTEEDDSLNRIKAEERYRKELEKMQDAETKAFKRQEADKNAAYERFIQERIKAEERYRKAVEKLQDDETKAYNKAKNTSYSGAMAYSSNAKTYAEEKQAIEYLTTARNNLSKADADFANKRNALNNAINKHTESLKRAGMTDSEVAEESAKTSEKRRQAALKEAEAYERRKKAVMDKWYSSSADRALNYSANTKSINEQVQAIKYLQIARANLSKGTMTEEEYRKKVMQITQEIKRQQDAVNNLLGANNNLASSHRNLMDISGQLMRKMALVFSVSQIQGYVSKLIAVRGEFELQQKSLQVLLQNKDEANKLWQQTVELAVKSPFRVSELVSYTRQLAAYRIETSKLHETTKKLADVSAGLGVDMNRLILAYGQVRAAEYLRGTELRQFTEAGIPMLDELAKRFTQLEGRAVSAGDVFERISKRLVSFKDVAAVFDKMTSAGGTFYRMQEEQSETLKGMISNLRDSFDLMMNDIGKSNEGLLKGTVSTLRKLVENWETIADILKVVISLIAVYRMGMLLTSKSMIEAAVAANVANDSLAKQITATQLLSLGWKRLGASIAATSTVLKASLPFLAASVVIGGVFQLISVLREHSKQIDDINEKYAKLRDRLQELSYAFNNAVDEKDVQTQKKKLESLIELANNEYHMKIKVDLTGATEDDIQKKFTEIQNRLTELNSYAQLFETTITKSTRFKASDIFDKVKDMSSEISNTFTLLSANVASVSEGMRKYANELSESEKEAYELLKIPQQAGESDVKYLDRLIEGYSILIKDAKEVNKELYRYPVGTDAYDKFTVKYNAVISRLKSFGLEFYTVNDALLKLLNSQTNAQDELNEVLGKSTGLFTALKNLSEDEKEVRLKVAINKLASERGWDDFVKDYIMRWTEQPFNIKFRVVPDEKTPLSAWQESYNKLFDSYYGFDKIEDGETTREKVIQRINGFLKEQKDLVEHIQKAGTGKGTAYEGYNLEEETRKMDELQKQITWFGISDKKTGDAQNKILNNRISLIKELNKEYEKLNKTMSAEESKRRVAEAYTPTFTQAFGSKSISFDFTNLKSVVEQLKRLAPLAAKEGAEAQLALSKAISEVQAEIDVQVRIEDDESIKRRISEMFGSYELSLELDKLNVPHDLAKQLFNIDVFDMDALKTNLNDATRGLLDSVYKMAQIENTSNAESLSNNEEYLKMKQDIEKRYSQADIDIARDAAKKLMDMEDKARLERLNKFISFLKTTSDEIAIAQTKGATDISFAKQLFSEGKIDASQYVDIVKNIVSNVNEEISKINLNKFKDSPEYIAAMGDMAGYTAKELEKIAQKIRNIISENASLMTPEEVKVYINALEKVNEQTEKLKNPFDKTFIQEIAEIKDLESQLSAEKKRQIALQSELVKKQERLLELQQLLKELQSKESTPETQQQISQTMSDITDTQNEISNINGQLHTTAGNISNIGNKLGNLTNGMSSSLAIVDKIVKGIYQGIEATRALYGDFKSMMDSFGVDTESGGWQDITIAMDTLGNVNQKAMQGFEDLKSGNIAGAVANTAGAVMSLVSGFNALHDAKYERKIQRELKFVEDLQHAYEKLEKAIDDAYAIDTLERSTKNAKANLQAQIDSYYKMIAAEEDKKKTDNERIKEWRYAIEDLREQIKELDEQAFNEATGNILDNVLNAATEFTDAWLEAFKETGNGLTGLEDNFKEAVANMLKQQASMLITSTYVDKWKKNLEKYINTDDLELTTSEAKKWVEDVKETLPQLSNSLKEYFDAMKGAGIDLAGSYEMSGLQRGLQEMNESTAQIIEAYLNSVRFYVAEQNTLLQNIAASLGASNVDNPMVEQLKIIASQTTAINNLLQGCTKGGHRLGGMGLKIFMD